jgi:ammonium transporter, Amt family
MLIFTGFYAFYGACLVIASTSFPGWANIYLSPTTLGSITMIITMGFAGGFTGGYFASRGDPFWTISGGLAGVIGVSAGADVYAPTLGYLIAMLTAVLVVYAGGWIETKMRVDDAVGAVAVHGVSGFLGIFWVGVFAAGYPTGINNVESSIGGQLMGAATFLPLGFLSGWVASFVMKKLNILRVPAEVELEGLDLAEYERDFYPEHERAPEQIVEPDGSLTLADELLPAELAGLTNGAGPGGRLGTGVGG